MNNKNKLLFLALSSILLLSCGNENRENKVTQYTIEQFMDNEFIGGGYFSHDNKNVLIHSNRSGIFNVYTIPIKGGKITPVHNQIAYPFSQNHTSLMIIECY